MASKAATVNGNKPQTIWKFDLNLGKTVIKVPAGGTIVHTAIQGGSHLCLWILVDPTLDLEERTFLMFGTGHVIDPKEGYDRVHVGTVLDGLFVWHVFEEKDAIPF